MHRIVGLMLFIILSTFRVLLGVFSLIVFESTSAWIEFSTGFRWKNGLGPVGDLDFSSSGGDFVYLDYFAVLTLPVNRGDLESLLPAA